MVRLVDDWPDEISKRCLGVFDNGRHQFRVYYNHPSDFHGNPPCYVAEGREILGYLGGDYIPGMIKNLQIWSLQSESKLSLTFSDEQLEEIDRAEQEGRRIFQSALAREGRQAIILSCIGGAFMLAGFFFVRFPSGYEWLFYASPVLSALFFSAAFGVWRPFRGDMIANSENSLLIAKNMGIGFILSSSAISGIILVVVLSHREGGFLQLVGGNFWPIVLSLLLLEIVALLWKVHQKLN